MFNIFKRLFIRKPRNPREITGEFTAFAHANADRVYNEIQRGMEVTPESYENLLVRHIRETGKSPFVGDDGFEEANQLLFENGIW